MANRYYNRTLECGCMISPDGGGGLIPCHYDNDPEQNDKCEKAWEKWRKTKDYKEYCKEIQEKNR